MRKSTLLKLALVFIAFFMLASAYAQTPVQYTADETETMVQTAGISFKLYVKPDPIYSPSYAGSGTLGTNSRWTFTVPAGLTATAPIVTGTPAPVSQNWVEITNPVANAVNYTVSVVESNTAFTCVDLGRSTLISVIAAPTATITSAALVAPWVEVTANKEYYRCAVAADAVAVPALAITYTEDARRVADSYDYILTVTRGGYDNSGTEIVAPVDVTAGFGKSAMNAIAAYATSPISHTTASTMSLLTSGTQLVRTKYVFTLANISSKTSYLSYFRANTAFVPTIADNYYPVATQTVTLWLNPAPVTGPIYHIPNAYAF